MIRYKSPTQSLLATELDRSAESTDSSLADRTPFFEPMAQPTPLPVSVHEALADFAAAYEQHVLHLPEPTHAQTSLQTALWGYLHSQASAPVTETLQANTLPADDTTVLVDSVSDLRCRDILSGFSSLMSSLTGGSGGGKTGTLVSDYYSGNADGAAGYDIWVHFSGSGWTQSLQKAFIDTANYLTSVITTDIGGNGVVNGKLVDDLYVSAELRSIDGIGGTLGQAGPTNVWTSNELTAAGMMQFDSADAGSYQRLGLWDDIVTHEFMHVMGFGGLWNYGANPLVLSSGQYTGTAALSAYNQATGSTKTYIPVETDGGTGTANAHWDEAALGKELMTGYINNSNYLSKYSVMSLADLGYNLKYKDYQYDNVVIG